MERIIDRFSKYQEFRGLNNNQVTVKCGLSAGLLGKAKSGKTDLGKKAVDAILKNFPDLNKTWLLAGEGDMILGNFGSASDGGSINHCEVITRLTDQNSRLLTIIEEQMQVIKNLSSK